MLKIVDYEFISLKLRLSNVGSTSDAGLGEVLSALLGHGISEVFAGSAFINKHDLLTLITSFFCD
jgi:hypothetical protein